MILDLSKEVRSCLELTAPAIVFFSMSISEQIAVLPILEKEQTYDFPDGDLLTSNALEVLIYAYLACLNKLGLSLLIRLDENNQETVAFGLLIEKLSSTAYAIAEDRFDEIGQVESLDASEWVELRRLSHIVQQQSRIELIMTNAVMRSFIDRWIHP